ncbi:NUDIX hydrolase [Anoxybacteroides tepidamans]|uniref:NUDIX hydrolase n=1 Tax=Anoxybacteroides tepidamans TaxID=265948 RepID=UPI0004845CA0|nr:NUDIX domain-containing protein [Anoxybacillus tepidamans]
MNHKLKTKVLAYVVRKNNKGWELLVFEHQDIPEAGIQVPGGTVESYDCDLSSAVLRELKEEAGIENATVLTEILSEIYYHKIKKEFQKRHFFIVLTDIKKDKWSHTVQSSGADKGLQFNYFWKELKSVSYLAGDQHIAIRHVIDFLANSEPMIKHT